MRNGTTLGKTQFLPFFKLSPFQGLKSPRLPTWFVGSLGLLLHRSKVRSNSKPPKWGIKRRFSNAINVLARLAHTRCGRGSQFAASVAGWCKNIHARFEVHSCYGSRDISILKWKFGKCAKWYLSHILSQLWAAVQLVYMPSRLCTITIIMYSKINIFSYGYMHVAT